VGDCRALSPHPYCGSSVLRSFARQFAPPASTSQFSFRISYLGRPCQVFHDGTQPRSMQLFQPFSALLSPHFPLCATFRLSFRFSTHGGAQRLVLIGGIWPHLGIARGPTVRAREAPRINFASLLPFSTTRTRVVQLALVLLITDFEGEGDGGIFEAKFYCNSSTTQHHKHIVTVRLPL